MGHRFASPSDPQIFIFKFQCISFGAKITVQTRPFGLKLPEILLFFFQLKHWHEYSNHFALTSYLRYLVAIKRWKNTLMRFLVLLLPSYLSCQVPRKERNWRAKKCEKSISLIRRVPFPMLETYRLWRKSAFSTSIDHKRHTRNHCKNDG